MSVSLSYPIPCCSYCLAVPIKDPLWMVNGSLAKTTEKLNDCVRCHLARYCSEDCKEQDSKIHQIICMQSSCSINFSVIDQMVKNVCKPQSGTVIFFLDPSAKSIIMKSTSEKIEVGKLLVKLKIEGKTACAYSYLICKSEFDWKSNMEALLSMEKDFPYPEWVELGLNMIEKELYVDAFQMIATKTPDHYSSLKNIFFQKAVLLMHSKGEKTDGIVYLASFWEKKDVM